MVKPFEIVLTDIEGDGLYDSISNVWCGTIICCDTQEVKTYRPNEIAQYLRDLKQPKVVCGHNIIDFDFPALEKVYGYEYQLEQLFDTLVFSRLLYPDLNGGHSLGAWGRRLGEPKWDFNEWHQFSERMLEYNVQDCKVNLKLLLRLMKYAGWDWNTLLELKSQRIVWDGESQT